jgi:hypothetical protein
VVEIDSPGTFGAKGQADEQQERCEGLDGDEEAPVVTVVFPEKDAVADPAREHVGYLEEEAVGLDKGASKTDRDQFTHQELDFEPN